VTTHAAGLQLFAALATIWSEVRFCGIYDWTSGTEAGFLKVLRVYLPILISPNAPLLPSVIRSWRNTTFTASVQGTMSHCTLGIQTLEFSVKLNAKNFRFYTLWKQILLFLCPVIPHILYVKEVEAMLIIFRTRYTNNLFKHIHERNLLHFSDFWQ
jgi:hypothetical protein